MSGRFHEIKHPLLNHKLSFLRDKNTSPYEFRELAKEISKLMCYEVMREWPDIETLEVETPIAKAQVQRIKNPPIIMSVMRAGNPVQDAVLSMLPFASAGHIGIYRDKFVKNTVEYYFKIPVHSEGRPVIVCDPLIATADTMIATLDRLKDYHVGKIRILCFLVSREGLKKLQFFHPDVDIYALNQEQEMNENGYLIPGLGDAGDRIYQTK